jgi:uncharacterized protein
MRGFPLETRPALARILRRLFRVQDWTILPVFILSPEWKTVPDTFNDAMKTETSPAILMMKARLRASRVSSRKPDTDFSCGSAPPWSRKDLPEMRFGVPERILRSLAEVFSRHSGIEEAWVYGSRARGDFRNESDIDIALFGAGLSFREFLSIRSELDDLPCLYTLDTTHFDSCGTPALKESILKDGAPFYRRVRKASPAYPEPKQEPMFVREDFEG